MEGEEFECRSDVVRDCSLGVEFNEEGGTEVGELFRGFTTLKLGTEWWGEDLVYPAIGVLVDKGPKGARSSAEEAM